MSSTGRHAEPVGSQGNAWANASTGVNTNSNVVDTWSCPYVSAFGSVSGACTITLFVSADGTNFYGKETAVLAGAGPFRIDVQTGARYVCLQSSAGVTATATIQAK